MKNRELCIAETAAAISDGVHQDREKFMELYSYVRDDWSGFPGIWVFIARCAIAYQNLRRIDDTYIEDCDKIAKAILAIEDKACDPVKLVQATFKS
jgi:hypothetical protein